MTLKRFNDYLNSFDYGAVINGEKHADLDAVDWSEYKTLSPEDFEDARMGICWDFVNYQHYVFQKLGVPDRSFFFVKRTGLMPDDIVTHTFSIIGTDDNIWFESAWSKHRGIYLINSYQDVVKILDRGYPPAGNPFEIHEYDAGKTIGLSPDEFFQTIVGPMS